MTSAPGDRRGRRRPIGADPASRPAGRAREADPDADPLAVAREIALRALTVRARSRSELADILARKRVPAEVAEELLERFEELRLVDDRDFSRQWVAGQERRLRSTRALGGELRRKGVDTEIVAETLAEVDPETDETVARTLVAKRLPSLRGLDKTVRYRRLAGLLARRGFSAAVVARVVREALAGEADAGAGDGVPEPWIDAEALPEDVGWDAASSGDRAEGPGVGPGGI